MVKAKWLSLVKLQAENKHLSSGLSTGVNGHEAKCKSFVKRQWVLGSAVQVLGSAQAGGVSLFSRPTWCVEVVDFHEPNIWNLSPW